MSSAAATFSVSSEKKKTELKHRAQLCGTENRKAQVYDKI